MKLCLETKCYQPCARTKPRIGTYLPDSLFFADDATDSLFSVENSGANAGQVSVTGDLDREADTTHTMNIRVRN